MISRCCQFVALIAALTCLGTGTTTKGYAQSPPATESTQAPPALKPAAPNTAAPTQVVPALDNQSQPASSPFAQAQPAGPQPAGARTVLPTSGGNWSVRANGFSSSGTSSGYRGLKPGQLNDYGNQPANQPMQTALANVQSVKHQYSVAESDDDRKKARDALRVAITEFFDAELKHRQDRIGAFNKRIEALSGHLEKRSAVKQEIVGLQVKAFLLEDAGSDSTDAPPVDSNRLNSVPTGVVPPAGGIGLDVPGDALPAAIKRLRSALAADNADEVRLASDAVRKALEDAFDKNLQSRKKELDAVRAQVANMSKAAAKRTARKQEIIDVQLQLALYDAEGLGFLGDSGLQFPEYGLPNPVPSAPGGTSNQGALPGPASGPNNPLVRP